MDRMSRLWAGVLLLGIVGVTVAPQSRADVLSAVAALRAGGCGGRAPLAAPLRHSPMLDQLAMRWAGGAALQPIAAREGYSAGTVSGLHLSTEVASVPERLSRSDCSTLGDPAWREIGFYQRKADTWLVLAGAAGHPAPQGTFVRRSPGAPPVSAAVRTADLSRRALQLVNDVRARGVRCGSRTFAPAPPLSLSGTLGNVALGHATDMAAHSYFEHQDLTGQSPADRVRAVGYREKLVGENIAYGPQSVDEVMQGWLDSPGHCENIMDPRFVEMGLALAAGRGSRQGLYWVQVLAEPRA